MIEHKFRKSRVRATILHSIEQLFTNRVMHNNFNRSIIVTMTERMLCLISLCIFISGCASTPQLNPEERARLGAVRIDPSISMPTQMYYMGPGGAWGVALGGGVGGAIIASSKSDGTGLSKFSEENGVQIEQIVREEVAKAFQQSGKIDLADAKDVNTSTMKIIIGDYGFSVPNGFSSKLVPVMSIRCVLVDRDGKTIWSANASVNPLGNPAEGKTIDELKANPKLIEASWRIALRSMMGDITSHM